MSHKVIFEFILPDNVVANEGAISCTFILPQYQFSTGLASYIGRLDSDKIITVDEDFNTHEIKRKDNG